MARIARAVTAGFPHHIVQRGNNRENVFIDDEDREKYMAVNNRMCPYFEASLSCRDGKVACRCHNLKNC